MLLGSTSMDKKARQDINVAVRRSVVSSVNVGRPGSVQVVSSTQNAPIVQNGELRVAEDESEKEAKR